jgi:hypothetical protein
MYYKTYFVYYRTLYYENYTTKLSSLYLIAQKSIFYFKLLENKIIFSDDNQQFQLSWGFIISLVSIVSFLC